MGVWDWITAFHEEAVENGDQDRMRLLQIFESASHFIKSDPTVMLGMLNEGRALAEGLGERRWVLFFDHWRLQTLLNHKGDFREVLEVATRATLEARKPAFEQFPQRVCLHEDLIYAYVGIDPEGYAERISQALEYMRGEVSPELECRFCVQHCRATFALRRHRLDEGEKADLELLEMTDAEPNRYRADHFALDAYLDLCGIAYTRGDWEGLRRWADTAEETARRQEDKVIELARTLAWQAVVARHEGDEAKGKRHMRGAINRARRFKAFLGESYYDARSAYHEIGGEIAEALAVRDEQLAALAGKGRHDLEAECRMQRCQLLEQLGRLTEKDLTKSREVAEKLRSPNRYLEELDKLSRRKQ